MTTASINFKPVKSNSKIHNERLVSLDYNYPELSVNNESWKAAEIQDRAKEIAQLCKKLSGRKMQKNATPIREAVVNLNPHHTMEDLQRLAKDLEKEKGISCFQIHIHRDEGVTKDNLNYHAHMLFDWQDKHKGKMKRLSKIDMSQIQTIVADSLNMERGQLKENTNRERLEAVQYKRQQEELRLQKLQKQVELLEQKKNRAAQANTAAREEYESLQKSNDAFKGLSGEEIDQLARKGIQMDKKSVRSHANALSGAIELQRQFAKGIYQDTIDVSNALNKLEKSQQYREYQQLKEQIRILEKRIR